MAHVAIFGFKSCKSHSVLKAYNGDQWRTNIFTFGPCKVFREFCSLSSLCSATWTILKYFPQIVIGLVFSKKNEYANRMCFVYFAFQIESICHREKAVN